MLEVRKMADLSVTVRNVTGTLQVARIRDHVVLCDLPGDHGTDLAPTPSELFLMAMADCVAMVACGYCRVRGIPHEGLTVTVEADRAKDEKGVGYWGNIRLRVELPQDLPPERVKALLRYLKSGCPVTATISRSSVEYDVATPAETMCQNG